MWCAKLARPPSSPSCATLVEPRQRARSQQCSQWRSYLCGHSRHNGNGGHLAPSVKSQLLLVVVCSASFNVMHQAPHMQARMQRVARDTRTTVMHASCVAFHAQDVAPTPHCNHTTKKGARSHHHLRDQVSIVCVCACHTHTQTLRRERATCRAVSRCMHPLPMHMCCHTKLWAGMCNAPWATM